MHKVLNQYNVIAYEGMMIRRKPYGIQYTVAVIMPF